ncbi:MAG TPA: hypothetical protein VGD58_31855 [Herpetosiphonaceae bacterium]
MSKDLQDFERFMQQREAAAGAYVQGDAVPLGQIVARVSNASFFSPRGDYVEGADAVWSRYEVDAGAFDSGSDNRFEILDMGASDGIAYWVGLQRSSARLRGKPEPVEFNLRITEIFRREGDEWKLIHRHADQLASEADEKQPAE